METKVAQTLPDAYNNLDPNTPLPGEEHPFYVHRPEIFQPSLLFEALQLTRADDKILFSGHKGSGKSTELQRLAQHLKERYLVAYIAIEDMLDLGDITYHDVLLSMAVKLWESADEGGVRLPEGLQSDLRNWYRRLVFEEEEVREEPEITFGAKFVIDFGLRWRSGPTVRKTIRAEVERRLSELLTLLNQLIAEIQKKGGRLPLVLLDGLDKVYVEEKVKNMFLEGVGALIAPACPIVYTVPISLLYMPELGGVRMSFRLQSQLPNVRPFNRDGSRCQEGWGMLDEILRRRVDESILPADARDALISLSGGVLKHLLSFAGEAVLRAMGRGEEKAPVCVEDVEFVAHRNRVALAPIFNASQRKELKRVAREHNFINTPGARDLALNLHILQYIEKTDGEEEWWDVHPLLKPILEVWSDE